MFGEAVAKGGKFGGIGNQVHERSTTFSAKGVLPKALICQGPCGEIET
jgi:hypothetical protein